MAIGKKSFRDCNLSELSLAKYESWTPRLFVFQPCRTERFLAALTLEVKTACSHLTVEIEFDYKIAQKATPQLRNLKSSRNCDNWCFRACGVVFHVLDCSLEPGWNFEGIRNVAVGFKIGQGEWKNLSFFRVVSRGGVVYPGYGLFERKQTVPAQLSTTGA